MHWNCDGWGGFQFPRCLYLILYLFSTWAWFHYFIIKCLVGGISASYILDLFLLRLNACYSLNWRQLIINHLMMDLYLITVQQMPAPGILKWKLQSTTNENWYNQSIRPFRANYVAKHWCSRSTQLSWWTMLRMHVLSPCSFLYLHCLCM